MPDKSANNAKPASPFSTPLEVVSALVGLILTLGILAIIGWHAFTGVEAAPPAISVSPTRIVKSDAGYVVEVVARNHSEATGAQVMLEGELKQSGQTVETSQAAISYVPGYSERRAGLLFTKDPRRFELSVRVTGFENP